MCGAAEGSTIRRDLWLVRTRMSHSYIREVASVSSEVSTGPKLIIEGYEDLSGRLNYITF